MKTVIILLLVTLFSGCIPRSVHWVQRREPITEADRKAVADQSARLLNHIPLALAGHDQDWDDAIRAAHDSAVVTYSPVTYWEFVEPKHFFLAIPDSEYTGRWRYADDKPTPTTTEK